MTLTLGLRLSLLTCFVMGGCTSNPVGDEEEVFDEAAIQGGKGASVTGKAITRRYLAGSDGFFFGDGETEQRMRIVSETSSRVVAEGDIYTFMANQTGGTS